MKVHTVKFNKYNEISCLVVLKRIRKNRIMTDFLSSPPAYQDPQDKVNLDVSKMTMIFLSDDVFGKDPFSGSKISMESIKRGKTSEKVDPNIKDPLNASIDNFNSAIDNVKKGDAKEAYLQFEQVISEATQGFNNADQANDLKSFQESMKAAQLIIFSSLARFVYDEPSGKMPYFKSFLGEFPIEKVEDLGNNLEKIVKKSIEQMRNIKKPKFSLGGSKKKPQELLDPVLKSCYPHISKAKNWITAGPNMSNASQTTVTINVIPQYLPRQRSSMLENLRVNFISK